MADAFWILIATTNRSDLLYRTLESLVHCRKPRNFSGVIVVENGFKKDAEQIVDAFRPTLPVRYQYIARANKSYALNDALKAVSDCLVFFTDDDVRVGHETLVAYASASEGVSRGRFYGGPMAVDYDRAPPEWLRGYLPPSATGWMPESVDPIHEEDVIFRGCNWAAFAEDIKEAGGFDPNFGPGSPTGSRGQETNMQRRLRQHGARAVYLPGAIVWHYVPRDRCSPLWALGRCYRAYIEVGARQEHPGPTLLGYPRWTIRELLKKTAKLIATVTRDPHARFDAAYHLFMHLGYMRGSRLAGEGRTG